MHAVIDTNEDGTFRALVDGKVYPILLEIGFRFDVAGPLYDLTVAAAGRALGVEFEHDAELDPARTIDSPPEGWKPDGKGGMKQTSRRRG